MVAVVVVVALVAGLASTWVAVSDRSGDEVDRLTPAEDGPTTTATSATPTDDPALDAAVAEAMAFVEDVRQLEFETEVDVELLADDEFVARLNDATADVEGTEGAGTGTGSDLDDDAWWIALHLVDPATDDLEEAGEISDDATVGFYDSDTDELVVRGSAVTTYVRVTLIHELTHALDDQHFDLDPPALDDAEADVIDAFSALVEGDAVRVEDEYFDQLSDDEIDEYFDEEERLFGLEESTGEPPLVDEYTYFPYTYGPDFVRALVEVGGEDEVDAAFEDPPTSTEHILDPDRYLAGDDPVAVEAPAADGEVVDEGVLGAFLLFLALADTDVDLASRASSGWAGDWAVVWQDAGQYCVRAQVALDEPRDRSELVTAIRAWASSTDGVRLEEGSSTVGFTSCGATGVAA